VSSSNGKHAKTTIAFDTWPLASRFRNTGIYVYARRLLSHFRDIAGNDSIEFRPLICEALVNDANQFEAGPGFQPYQTNFMSWPGVVKRRRLCFSLAKQGRRSILSFGHDPAREAAGPGSRDHS
jgi:hypothetical protein